MAIRRSHRRRPAIWAGSAQDQADEQGDLDRGNDPLRAERIAVGHAMRKTIERAMKAPTASATGQRGSTKIGSPSVFEASCPTWAANPGR